MMFLEFQLRLCKGISFAAVAAHADKNGRRKLAAMLVEHESRSSKQVLSFSFSFLFFKLKFDCYKGFFLGSHAFFSLVKVCYIMTTNSCNSFPKKSTFYVIILILFPQVPLLLSIGEEDTALTKATESGDTDLVYLVLFHIWQKVLLPS